MMRRETAPASTFPRPLLPILLYLLISLAGTPDFSRVKAVFPQLAAAGSGPVAAGTASPGLMP